MHTGSPATTPSGHLWFRCSSWTWLISRPGVPRGDTGPPALCDGVGAMRSFADIPAEIERRLDVGERVALVLLDAFGLRFLERHADHPLVARLDVTPLSAQFPSTTTAHVTTIHFGVPVEQHGLYEWHVYEPALGRMICPLPFVASGTLEPLQLDPQELAPGPTFYRRLGRRCSVFEPSRISGSTFGRLALDGADAVGYDGIERGASALAAAMASADGPDYALLYWDAIDATGHVNGPSSPEFDAQITRALDALWDALAALDGVTLLFTADHGQVDVSPARVDYLDELWPQLPARLSHAHPAGSARDVFLHVREEHVDEVIGELSSRLEDRARVCRARELFDGVGERLAARLGDVAVLPAAGREAWLSTHRWVEQGFKGHHGGLHPDETATYLAELSN